MKLNETTGVAAELPEADQRGMHLNAGRGRCGYGTASHHPQLYVMHECNRPDGHAPIARGQGNVHICSCGYTWPAP